MTQMSTLTLTNQHVNCCLYIQLQLSNVSFANQCIPISIYLSHPNPNAQENYITERISHRPSVLPGHLVPPELQQGLLQPGVQHRGQPPGCGLLRADRRVASQLGPQSAALVPVDPDEEARMRGRGGAVGDPVGPVLRETVVLGRGGQAAPRHRQTHRHVRPVAADVVAPEGRHRLLHAALA